MCKGRGVIPALAQSSQGTWPTFNICVGLVNIMRKVDAMEGTLLLGWAGGRPGNFFKLGKN